MSFYPGVSRCFFHAATGFTLAVLVDEIGKTAGLWLLGGCLVLTVIGEGIRLGIPSMNRLFIKWVGPLLKEEEKSRPAGVGYFLAGVWIALWVYDLEIALASMVILAVGDPAAAFVGKRWGRFRIGQKSLEGTLAFCVCAFLVGWASQGIGFGYTLPVFTVGVVTGALVELLPLKIDDNLVLPVVAGLAMQGASSWV